MTQAAPRRFSAVVNASGKAVISISPSGMYPWRVDQVSTEMLTAPSGAASFLRLNGMLVTALIATGDVADGAPSVPVNPSDALTVEWSACTPGHIGYATLFYDDGVPA